MVLLPHSPVGQCSLVLSPSILNIIIVLLPRVSLGWMREEVLLYGCTEYSVERREERGERRAGATVATTYSRVEYCTYGCDSSTRSVLRTVLVSYYST